jgi:LysM repeat protein
MKKKIFIFYLIFSLFIDHVLLCREHFQPVENDTCHTISKNYGISLQELIRLNKDINCENLQQTKICVSNSIVKRDMIENCAKTHKMQAGEVCFTLRMENRLSENFFNYLNPNIDCQNLKIGSLVCIDDGLTGCVEYYKTNKTDTCIGIGDAYDFDVESLEVNNSGLNCSNLVEDTSICILFRNPNCSFVYYVNIGDTSYSIMRRYNININDLYTLNPTFRYNFIYASQGICLASSLIVTYNNVTTNKITKRTTTKIIENKKSNVILIVILSVCIPIAIFGVLFALMVKRLVFIFIFVFLVG